jgi:hypothetical protein
MTWPIEDAGNVKVTIILLALSTGVSTLLAFYLYVHRYMINGQLRIVRKAFEDHDASLSVKRELAKRKAQSNGAQSGGAGRLTQARETAALRRILLGSS